MVRLAIGWLAVLRGTRAGPCPDRKLVFLLTYLAFFSTCLRKR